MRWVFVLQAVPDALFCFVFRNFTALFYIAGYSIFGF